MRPPGPLDVELTIKPPGIFKRRALIVKLMTQGWRWGFPPKASNLDLALFTAISLFGSIEGICQLDDVIFFNVFTCFMIGYRSHMNCYLIQPLNPDLYLITRPFYDLLCHVLFIMIRFFQLCHTVCWLFTAACLILHAI